MAFGTAVSRKLLLTMVLLVVALDVLSIAVYYAARIPLRGQNVQTAFVVVWTMATLAIVLVYLQRIRKIRDASLGRVRGSGPRGRR